MGVHLSWYLKGRIIYTPGTLDRDDMVERNRLTLALIEAEGEPPYVHVLIDHSCKEYKAEDLQDRARSLKYYVQLGEEEVRQKLLTHPLFGWVISIATPTASLKMAGTVSSQQRNYRWHSVSTLDEALEFLQSRDPSLPDLKHV